MEACAVICGKATLRFPKPISSLPGANPYLCEHKIEVFVRFCPSEPPFSVSVSAITCHQYKESRVCCPAILSSIWCFEHKIGIFVRFWPSEPPFSGVSSTNSRFLCFFGLRDPFFRAFRAQNRGFCALLGSGTLIFRVFEHKIGIFVLKRMGKWDWKP